MTLPSFSSAACRISRPFSRQLRFGRSSLKTRPMATDAVDATSDATLANLWQEFSSRQKNVAQLTISESARTIIQNSTTGMLSVLSPDNETDGFPNGSLVNYAADEDGKPLFCLSDLAVHTRCLRNDTRASLLVPETENVNIQCHRVTLTGNIELLESDEERLREAYLKKHPGAVYVDFGDFHWFKMKNIIKAQFAATVTNLARAGTVNGDVYLDAVPDPVAPFGIFICRHMNGDHANENKAIVESMTGFEIKTAEMKRVDRLGMDFYCTCSGMTPFICRIPFSRPALVRTDVKDRIIELTNQASEKQTSTTEQRSPQ